MRPSPDLSHQDLETRTREAHRTYIEAFRHWENVRQETSGVGKNCAGDSVDERRTLCDTAEARKERLRVVFRNLCDELGYLPFGLNTSADGTASG